MWTAVETEEAFVAGRCIHRSSGLVPGQYTRYQKHFPDGIKADSTSLISLVSKAALVLVLLLLISGCIHNDSNPPPGNNPPPVDNNTSLKDVDLSGTWQMVTEVQQFKTSTEEYLQSSFYEEKYFLDDTVVGVEYSVCRVYGGIPVYGIKTDKHFYMNVSDDGFVLQDDGTLMRSRSYTNSWEPGFNFVAIETLTKISDNLLLDSGTFIFNGPVAITEHAHVCRRKTDYSVGIQWAVNIQVPYDDDYLTFNIEIRDAITAGTYTYARRWDATPVQIEVYSNATAFWNIVGTNTIGARDVSVTIIEVTDLRLSGTFSFTGQDDGSYSGEFEVFLVD